MREEVFEIPEKTVKLFGVVHKPDGFQTKKYAVLMVVGGPQNRLGSHRSYVQIARGLCRAGHPVVRFDYAGVGDSPGPFVGYQGAAKSIRLAVDSIFIIFPFIKVVFLWSLCDGSTACAWYAPSDRDRIGGMILCNPYVRSQAGEAEAFLKFYYLNRILQKEFWKKVGAFQFNIRQSLKSFWDLFSLKYLGKCGPTGKLEDDENIQLPKATIKSLSHYAKPVAFMLSTDDLTAKEFEIALSRSSLLSQLFLMGTFKKYPITGSDHTFSSKRHTSDVIQQSICALNELLLPEIPSYD